MSSNYNLIVRGDDGAEIAIRDIPEGELIKLIEKEGVSLPPVRKRLPMTRNSITHKFEVAGHEGYLTVGLYENGKPGEMFVTMAKEGSTMAGTMDAFGTAISLTLQYGVDGKVLCSKFRNSRFEPSGYTKNPDIPQARSIMDYIFTWIDTRFYGGDVFSLPEKEGDNLGLNQGVRR